MAKEAARRKQMEEMLKKEEMQKKKDWRDLISSKFNTKFLILSIKTNLKYLTISNFELKY